MNGVGACSWRRQETGRAISGAFLLRFLAPLVVGFVGVGPVPGSAAALTINACGTLAASTQWTADNVYVLNNCGATVAVGATLTVQPGTVVKFGGASTALIVNGTLDARGTAGAPIVFTSLRDDAHGGDTNGDGSSAAAPGDWASVRFSAGSHGQLVNVLVAFGGSGAFDAGGRYGLAQLESFSSDVTLDHATLRSSRKSGLYCENASVQVAFARVEDNAEYGLYWSGVDAAVPLQVTDSTFAGNGAAGWLQFRNAPGSVTLRRNVATGANNGFRADGRLNGGSLAWDNAGALPLVVNPGLALAAATTATFAAGSVVKLSGRSAAVIVNGTLEAEGTPQAPVTFTSINDDTRAGDTNGDGAATTAAPGQWASVRFEAGGRGRVTYTSFEYGGSGAFDYGGRYGRGQLESYSSDVTLDHTTLRASAMSGLYGVNASVSVSSGQVIDNGEYGLRWDGVDPVVPLEVADTTFSGNGAAAGWLHFTNAAGIVSFDRNRADSPKNGFRADGRLNIGSLTWNNGDQLPLLIAGGLSIAPATTLSLESGTVVKFAGAADALVIEGALEAHGAPGAPLAFTSVADDAHGGDTNGDGVSQGAAKQWATLRFAAGSRGRVDHAFFGYGGSGAFDSGGRYGKGMVESFSSDVTFDHCALQASGIDGLYAENATVNFTDGTVADNVRYGLNYNGLAAAVPLVVTGNAFAGSQGDAVRLDLRGNPPRITFRDNTGTGTQRRGFSVAGTMTTDAVWDNTASLPLVVDGGLTVAPGTSLTVLPGTVVKFATVRDVLHVQGALHAAGTPDAPIAFTSLKDDGHGGDTNGDGASGGEPGDWSGVRFAAGSSGHLGYTYLGFGASGVFDYALRYGQGMLESFSTDVTLDHVTLRSSKQHGLLAVNSSVTTTNSSCDGNLGVGLYFEGVDPLAPLALRDNEFTRNGAYGAWVHFLDTAVDVAVEGNRSVAPKNGLRVSGVVKQGILRWENPDAVMVVDGGLATRPQASFDLAPGSVVKFAAPADVLQVEGALAAEGSFAAPIAFTSLADDGHGGDTNGDGAGTGSPGQWAGLRFLAGSRASLRHAFVGYGSSGVFDHLGYYGRGLLDIRGGVVRVRHGGVRGSASHGLYVENADVQIQYTAITGHARNGIFNATPGAIVDARHDWWGDESGPRHPRSNPAGKGSVVSDGVSFLPWSSRYAWLEPTSPFVHGVATLTWSAFDVDPDTLSSGVTASGAAGTQELASAYPAGGETDWDTRPLPNGPYELRAEWRDLGGFPVAEVLRPVVVNNDPNVAWHGGNVVANETWGPGRVHVVEADVVVAAGTTLSITPGAVVKFTPGTRIVVEDGGILDAPASETAPIVLTSMADDVSGDTNFDGTQGVPRPGDWNGIVTRGTGAFNDTPFVDVRYTLSEHAGLLAADERWRGEFTHHLTGDVIVAAGATLTIAAGAVVKFDSFKGIVVQPGGRLVALGTVAAPIVFTSVRDDAAGGDTNGDADQTTPAPGDWRWIYVDGAEASFDHVEMRYGAGTASGNWDQTGMVRTNAPATLTVTNCVLRDAFFDGILAWGGTADISNSVFVNIDRAISAHPGSPVHVRNCTVDDNRIGLLVHGGTLDVVNTIVSNSHESGIQYDFGTLASVRYSDVWAPAGSGSVNYRATADRTGSDGNFSRDPAFVDRPHGNFRLDFRSPAIDAADGPSAPAQDSAGTPRYDDPRTPNSGVATATGAFADMGAHEFAETAPSNLDLIVTALSGPTAAVAGENARLQWTVTNIGSEQVVGPWHDTVNLVASPDANPTVVFAAEVLVGDGARLGPGQSVTATAEIRVPGSIVAAHRWQVVTNTRGEVFEGRNRDNNSTLSLAAVNLDLPQLVVGGAALSRRFEGAGQAHWFKFAPAAGEDVSVRVDRDGSGGATELYIGQGYMPSRERFDARQHELNAPDVSALAAGTAAQTYYVLAYPASLPGGAAGFTVAARALDFSLTAAGPRRVGNAGAATLTVQGGKLRSDMTFELVDASGAVHVARSVFVSNPAVAYVTFDVSGLPAGTAAVRVRDGARIASLPGGIDVAAGTPGRVQARLNMPRAMRPDWTETISVDYANAGDTDVLAPLMVLSVSNARLRLPGKTGFVHATVQLLGINPEGPAGILPPGARGTIALEMQPTAAGGSIDGKLWVLSDPNQPWDWNAAKALLRPDFVPADAWEPIFANFIAGVGTTVGQYNAALAADATYSSQLGEYTGDVQRLLMFELNQAGLGEITRRYTLGAFGRGLPAWWEAKASTDAAGNVRIAAADALRYFTRRPDGSYQGVPGDRGTLTREGGAYRVREANGFVVAFRSNGGFDYIEDRLGRRLSATYSAGRITGLIDDTGDTVSYTYSPQGRIVQMTDPVGRVTTYTYDATGELLTAVADAGGTTRFTYDDGALPASRYALRSITLPDNTHRFLEYDSQGRLARTSRDGGAEAQTYTYDAAGGVTTTDATGSRLVTLLNDGGQAARLVDALSNDVTVGYDDRHRPTRLNASGGGSVSVQYDTRGNLGRVVDSMGRPTTMAYESAFDQLTALTNAAGHTIQYLRDARGNVTSVTYPNGDQEHVTYDTDGNTATWTNGRGRTIRHTYDSHHLVTRQDFPDGSRREFAYDAHRNLTAASDVYGTTRLAYDQADRLTRITYPSGRFLEFTYDTGGRRVRSVDQDGFAVNYLYDAAGRLAGLTEDGNTPIVALTFDAAGQLTRRDAGNGTYTTYEYDLDGQVLHLVNFHPDGTVLSRFDYTYDSQGRRARMGTADGNWTYEYDAAGQLVRAVFDSSDPAVANQDFTYEYDAAGNRVRTVRNGDVTPYGTNSADQYVRVGAFTCEYDADGNLVSRADGATHWTYTYDDENRLTAVNGPGGTWTYEYDVFGGRRASTFNGQRTEYLVDPAGPGNVVAVYDAAGAPSARYVHGAGLVGRVGADGRFAYLGFDALGSTSELTNSVGGVLNRYRYGPFGERLSADESVENPFQYVGMSGVMHEGSGVEFMRARFFLPALGRFLQRDPIGIAGGGNLQSYTGNDPVNFSDPLGLVSPSWMFHQVLKQLARQVVPNTLGAWEIIEHMNPGALAWQLEQWGYGARVTALRNLFFPHLMTNGPRLLPAPPPPFLTAPPVAQPPPPQGGGVIRHIAGRSWQAIRPVITNPYVISAAAGVLIGTGLRYIESVDEAAQMTLVDLDDLLGGWLLWTPRTAELGTGLVSSHDPNDIIGPAGNGAARWVSPEQTLPYKIRFENDKQASAPAQTVRITERLDADLDPSSFELGAFNFDGVTVTVPAGRTAYHERLDLRATHGLYLEIGAEIDFETGTVTWEFVSVDPTTGRTPRDPLSGFLPPNVTAPVGEGYVTYTIRPRADSPVGTSLDAEASIVFDTNEPIDTPLHRNPVGPIADCTGDCDAGGEVTIDELLTMVNIALGNAAASRCTAGDRNADGEVTVEEIVVAVNYALSGCPVEPVPSPRPSPTTPAAPPPTPTPSALPTPTPTARPSRTPTPTASATSTAAPSAHPTLMPTGTVTRTVAPQAPVLRVGTVGGRPGDRVEFIVTVKTNGHMVAGTQNDIGFNPLRIRVAAGPGGDPDCTVNPALVGWDSLLAFRPLGCFGAACTGIRVLVFPSRMPLVIADGSEVYRCTVDIAADATVGTYPLAVSGVALADADGASIPGATGTDGAVIVQAPPG